MVQQHCQRHRCGNCAYQTECGTKIPLANQTSSFLIVNISNQVLGLNLNQPGISTYTPNYLCKDIFHRTISLQVIWRKVKVWAKVTKRQGGQFRIYCYGSKGPHQLVEVNPLYTCHKEHNKTHKPQNRGSEASPSARQPKCQVCTYLGALNIFPEPSSAPLL